MTTPTAPLLTDPDSVALYGKPNGLGSIVYTDPVTGQLPSDLIPAGAYPSQIGTGSNVSAMLPTPVGASLLNLAIGTSGAPDTTLTPAFQVNRLITQPYSASIVGDGAGQLAAIVGTTVGDANTQVQMVGTLGAAVNNGTSKGAADSPDACGLYGIGRSYGVGLGIGLFAVGHADASTALVTAAQLLNYNASGAAFTPSTTGFSGGVALLITDGGPQSSACGIEFDNSQSQQFHTGIHANAHVTGGLTGGISTNFIFDESHATNSLNISGSHTYAMLVQPNAGKVVIGASSGAFAPALLEVRQPTATTGIDPMMVLSADSASGITSLQIRNGSGGAKFFVAGGAGNYVNNSVAGDTGVQVTTATKRFLIGGTSTNSVLSVTAAGLFGAFGVTEAAQPTLSYSRSGAGETTAVAAIRTSLASLGWVKDSTTA